MQAQRWNRIVETFSEAVLLQESERTAYIVQACGGDLDLEAQIQSLLEAHEYGKGPLDVALELPIDVGSSEIPLDRVGADVGPYVLLRAIGEGGMGRVWLAERRDGVPKRTVALKLPHVSWMGNSAERLARERDILASLEHPNIARLYDAGVTTLQRPYLALEYIDGIPITEFCLGRECSLATKVDLLLQVLDALQYAHSRFVLHRDIKPSNVLVSGDARVHLLDFGISNIVGATAAEGHFVAAADPSLTPQYASPEQLRREPLSAASDVYSVGVVAYELLTGCRPMRTIDSDPKLASRASSEVALGRHLKGDLDAILAKALQTEPTKRYASIAAFADDLNRYRKRLPVAARPSTVGYRSRKFILRNALPVGAAAIVIMAILIATVVALRQAQQARREASRAEASRDYLLSIFRAADPRTASDKPRSELTAKQLLDISSARIETRFAGQPELQIELLGISAHIYGDLADEDRYNELERRHLVLAEAHYGPNHPTVIGALIEEANAACVREEFVRAEQLLGQADAALTASGTDRTVQRANWWRVKARLLGATSASDVERGNALDRALELLAELAPNSNDYAETLSLASIYRTNRGEDEQAMQLITQALAVEEHAADRDDASIADLLYDLARKQEKLGDFVAAETYYQRAEDMARRTYGERHYDYWISLAYHGRLLHMLGQRTAAQRLFGQMLAAIPTDWKTNGYDKWARQTYAERLAAEGQASAAIPLLEEANKYYAEHRANEYDIRESRRMLGDAYDRAGRSAEARNLLKASRDEFIDKEGLASPWTARIRERWARFQLDHATDDAQIAGASTEFQAVLDHSARPSAEASLAHAGLSRIALRKGNGALAIKESTLAMTTLDGTKGLYDVRVQPYIWLIHSAVLLSSGDASGARRWATRAFEASMQYDDPSSPEVSKARDAMRLTSAPLG
ncbi:MAG: serine/threonine-protein kinase [Steroidobacteraceae bacterium]